MLLLLHKVLGVLLYRCKALYGWQARLLRDWVLRSALHDIELHAGFKCDWN